MHSFASEHNALRWRLVVQGVPARWPAFVRVFPVAVYPDVETHGTPQHPAVLGEAALS